MKVLWPGLFLLFVGCSLGVLPPPERSYKILMILPVSSVSHRNVFLALAKALAERGHKIVMFTNDDNPIQTDSIFEMSHDLPDFKSYNKDLFETRKLPDGGFSMFTEILPVMAKKIYKIPEVTKLYEKRKDFDLIIIDHFFNEMMYPFVYEMTFITLATPGLDPKQSSILGNPPNPAYVPSIIGGADLTSAFGRLFNVFLHIATTVHWRWVVLPLVEKEINILFPDLPPLLEIERNQSLSLMNSHFSMDMVVPLLPSQVEVGCMQCRPGVPLPENVKSWIEGAGSAGVIYFSLGSVARSETIPSKYKVMLLEAFKKLDQRVIWKFESNLEGTPENVMIRKWLPQQDILAHPNVRVFITHGGRLSTQEATFHAKPLLALPIFGDQAKNAEEIVGKGFGLSLVWEELTVEKIVDALKELIHNPRYKETLSSVSKSFRDQPETPKDRAVFWTEYVIRHKGAPRLRSPAIELSWVHFLMLDVLAVILFGVSIVVFISRWSLKKICKAICGSSEGKKKRE